MYSWCDYPYKSCLCIFGPTIPTSSFNFQFFFILVTVPFLLHSGQLMIHIMFWQLYHLAWFAHWLSTSLSMVKTTMIGFSLDVTVLSLSPAMHLVSVYNVCMWVHVYAVCHNVIASVFRRTGQLSKLKSVPAYIPSASKGWPSTGIHFDFRLWDYQKTPECMVTPMVLTWDNLVPWWRLILNFVHSTSTIINIQRSCDLFHRGQ